MNRHRALPIALILAGATLALAKPGDPDPSYGAAGIVRFKHFPSEDLLRASVRLPDGGLLSAGSAGGRLALLRRKPDGMPDAAFGSAGWALHPMPSGWSPAGVAIQPGEKILAYGGCNRTNEAPGVPIFDICIARFHADGSLDPDFGTQGEARLGVNVESFRATSHPDGRLTFAWRGREGVELARMTAEGVPDLAFGTAGRTAFAVYGAYVNEALIQSDGRLVVVGGLTATTSYVARFLEDGRVDSGYGSAGLATIPVGGYNVRAALRSDDKVVVAGCAYFPATTTLVRVEGAGILDSGFANAGIATIPGYCARNIAAQADGRLLLFDNPSTGGPRTNVLRLDGSGALDKAFGDAGVASFQLEGILSDVLPRSDGRLELPFYTSGFGLLRLLEEGQPDPSFGVNGVAVADSGVGAPGYIQGIGATADGRLSVYIPSEVVRIAATGQSNERVKLPGPATWRFALQPDGRMLVLTGTQGSWQMRRFDPDGQIDPAFGARDITPTHAFSEAGALEVLPDGRIAVALTSYPGEGGVVQLLPDGAFDPTFGTGLGSAGAVFPGDATNLSSIAPYGGRSLLVGGLALRTSEGDRVGAIRLVDGAYDMAFGVDGRFIAPPLTAIVGKHTMGVRKVLVRRDGRGVLVTNVTTDTGAPVLSGSCNSGTYLYEVVLFGFDEHGELDPSLGQGGSALAVREGWVSSAVLDGAGRIVVAGSRITSTEPCKSAPFVARFTERGAPDTTFGVGGFVDLAGREASGLAMLPGGAIGVAMETGDPELPFAAQRLEGGGAYDIFTDPQLFAMQQYRDFLGRQGDGAGIDFWAARISAGVASRGQVIESFFGSPEFQGTMAPVARLYFAYFLRVPDYEGLNYWISEYRNGNSLGAISQQFAASAEFQSRYGALDNAGFVTLVYQNVLGRAPDPQGFDFWKGQLDTAQMTRGQVMLGFSESPEYRDTSESSVFVTMTYFGMMRRAPDPQGFDFWVQYRDAGNSGLALIDGFLASPEYRNRFLP